MNPRDGYIECVMRRERTHRVLSEEKFELKRGGKYVWLQRACIWVLRRLGCRAWEETYTVERHYVGRNGEKFMDRARNITEVMGLRVEVIPWMRGLLVMP